MDVSSKIQPSLIRSQKSGFSLCSMLMKQICLIASIPVHNTRHSPKCSLWDILMFNYKFKHFYIKQLDY